MTTADEIEAIVSDVDSTYGYTSIKEAVQKILAIKVRVPEKYGDCKDCCEAIWDNCIEEVKRLNGIEP